MQVCTLLQTDNHASTPQLSFFTGRMPFLPPNQQRQSTEGNHEDTNWQIGLIFIAKLQIYWVQRPTNNCHQSASKCTKSRTQFQKFSRGDTPGPLSAGGRFASRPPSRIATVKRLQPYSHCSLSFSSSGLNTWIRQTFTVTSEHIRFFYFFCFTLFLRAGD